MKGIRYLKTIYLILFLYTIDPIVSSGSLQSVFLTLSDSEPIRVFFTVGFRMSFTQVFRPRIPMLDPFLAAGQAIRIFVVGGGRKKSGSSRSGIGMRRVRFAVDRG